MCAIVGVVSQSLVNQDIFDALTALQHRGQDAAGILTTDKAGRIHIVKGTGLVRDVIRTRHMFRLQGEMGIGHVRYPTAGTQSSEEAQPFYVNSPYGIGLAHNGNLTNTESLKKMVLRHDLRHLNTDSDSEVLLNIFAHELQELKKINPKPEDIFQAIEKVHERCSGAYAVVALLSNVGLVAFRDKHGIRPLIYGKRLSMDKKSMDYMIASESAALSAAGFDIVADIAPGEAIFISSQGEVHQKVCLPKGANFSHTPCIFEYIYLARQDSVLDKISVHQVRLYLGEKLAKKIQKVWANIQIDVVIPIPDTSRTAAAMLARVLNVDFREGFVRNRYIGRTFIMPGQALRKRSVRQKLNTIPSEFANKNVLLVDDSIVRGTTSREMIQMARQAGAAKVYFGSAAPEIRFPNVYGIDMPSAKDLIAYHRTHEEITQSIEADGLIFQDLKDLYDACYAVNPEITHFEDSVFTGNYISGDIDEAYLMALQDQRNDVTGEKN